MPHDSVTRFAFDLGTNSIGWAVLKGQRQVAEGQHYQGQRTTILDIAAIGARIFPDGRNPKDGTSLAMMRRAPKAARRRRDRFLARQRKLIATLIAFNLLPKAEGERKRLERLDPYQLRAKGLNEALSPHEFGRVLFHLNQRRGFQSNRKADAKDKESGVLKEAAKRLAESLHSDGSRTLGEFLARRVEQGDGARFRITGIGPKAAHEFYPTRELIKSEFMQLWDVQAPHCPQLLTNDAKSKIHDAIFHQRPLKPVKPGRCTLNPNEERLPAALPSVEARRIYQALNELRFGVGFSLTEGLNLEQRDLLASKLLRGESVTWKELHKFLKLDAGYRFSRQDIDDGIEGCQTTRRLAGTKRITARSKKAAFGERWHPLPLERKDEIVHALLDTEDQETLTAWLVKECNLSEDEALIAADTSLPDGYGRLGATANAAILDELRADVVTYAAAAKNAGYHHSDFSSDVKFDRLPYYGQALERHVGFGTGVETDADDKRYGRIANPTVHIGLNQLRRLTNRLIEEYGKPDEVVIELARELKLTKKQKDELAKKNLDNRKVNEKRTEKLDGVGVERNGLNRMLLRLWEEQRDGGHSFCPYSGAQISIEQLFSAEVEIDHILPFSRTLDDSIANKVVCFREANREKRNRTPHEAFHFRAAWEGIAENAKKLPPNKRWRFAEDAMERFNREGRDFLDRQLNETKHLARAAKTYLEVVSSDVWVVNGALTALLRGKWGLNSILGDDNRKNRNDHRHHAIDAAAIGCISRSLLNELSRRAGQAEDRQEARIVADIPDPFEGFRDRVRDLARSTIVSHKPEHGKGGALHEDTAYGLVRNEDERAIGNLVYRKSLSGLTDKEIDRVRDPVLRGKLQAVRNSAKALGLKLDAALIAFAEQEAAEDAARTGQTRNPIRHVRLLKPEASNQIINDRRTGEPYKALVPGENWCMDIVSLRDGKGGQVWKGFAASVFEANQPNWHPRWEREKLGGKLIMRLHKGDLVEIDDPDGVRRIKKVVQLREVSGHLFMATHHEAGTLQARHEDTEDAFRWDMASIARMNERKARKVRVDAMGIVSST